MKRFLVLLLSSAILFCGFGCEESERSEKIGYYDQFSLVINDTIIYDNNSIDFYDFSSGLIYLKAGNTFKYEGEGTFSVKVDNERDLYGTNALNVYFNLACWSGYL